MKFVTYILVGITVAIQCASAATNLTASSYNFNENDNLTGGTVLNLSGENGADIGATAGTQTITGTGRFIGGTGGNSDPISSRGHGGNGLSYVFSYTPSLDLVIEGELFKGGNGGTVENFDLSYEYNSVQLSNLVGLKGSSGGHGIYMADTEGYQADSGSVTIQSGMFIGGNGGSVTNSREGVSQKGYADAGHGAVINDVNSLTINDGIFMAGQPGVSEGEAGKSGYDALLRDNKNVVINGGAFTNNGAKIEAIYYTQNITINDGLFSALTVSAIDDSQFLNTYENYVDESSLFYTFDYSGSNNITINGGQFDLIDFTGTQNNQIALDANASISFAKFSGATNIITSYDSSNLQNTEIGNSSVTLTSGNFTLSNGGEVDLTHENAALNFNGGISTFEAGSTLDVGLGVVSGADIVMASNSVTKIGVSANGASSTPTKGTLTASSSIDFEEGAIVQLVNDGTYTKWDELEGTDGIIIANASSITALNTNQVSIVGDKPWLTGVIGLNFDSVSDNLYAEIGLLDLGTALNATGELAIMADKLQPLIDGSAEIAGLFRDGFPTQQAAISGITDSFFRAPEVANSLVGLQSVVRDQVAGRTRGYLKANRFGASVPRGPRGPDAGWWDRSMERINESLPKADLRGGLDALNASLPKVELSLDRQEDQQQSYYKRFMNWLNEKVPSFKPSAPTLTSDYKSWGKAYYSDLAQDAVDGFAGYEAQAIGGIAGMDRKLNHGVLGWAAGYADTTILGNFGQNADVDTLHGTIYYTAATQRAYLDASMSYAYSLVETIGPAGAGGYTADYNASNLSFALGAGVGFTAFNDRVQVTPEFLFLSTLYDQEAYTETSAITGMPDKQFSAYDDWSHKVELGATFSLLQILESTSMNVAIQPELRLHWLHELNPNLADQSYLFAGDQFTAALQAREENLLRTGLGIRFWDWADHRTEFSFDLDAITGSDYEEFTVSGSFIHRF